jgi:cellobiose phosphorylase
LVRYLKASARTKGQAEIRKRYDKLFAARSIQTPDQSLNRYINEWLPIQLAWVNQLDRGWPTGMRGVRDAAQDSTGIVPLDPQAAKIRLLELFSVQRSDGWFPRQYSTQGPDGRHDLRAYVDSGCWVWELLWEYLAQTLDFALLRERLCWLDQRRTAPVLAHVIDLFDYYIRPANLGEHGLCKIREGDWNDSVNAAGLEGRGESVMVSCQVVLGLSQCVELLRHCGASRHAVPIRLFQAAEAKLRGALRRHALNRSGYFNAVFNDAGQWIFSPDDPDGRARINGPANCFAVIAGLLPGASQARVFEALNRLRGPHGWRLFHPPIGSPPIPKLGRIGQGDLAPGVGENGTSYNHGSHGFLGRAAAVAGRGDMLYESLRYMLPYDQEAHPVFRARTAPYAVPNHWKEAIGQDGIGGDTFLSGSISTALRNVYQGLVGFRPELTHLVIDPVIPADWPVLRAKLPWLGKRIHLRIQNPDGVESGVNAAKIDGRPVPDLLVWDEARGRFVLAVPSRQSRQKKVINVEVTLGRRGSSKSA